MRIAVLVAHFPALSETFILNQITGLLERGHTVDIYAERPGKESKQHPDVERYGLLARTRYTPPIPGNSLVRTLKGIGLAARHLRTSPRMVGRSLNVLRYGRQAASLKLLYRMGPFLPACPHYDVIHAHFGQGGLRGLALRELGVLHGPLVTTFLGCDMSSYLRKAGPAVYDQLFAKGDLFLPCSEKLKEGLLQLGCEPGKTVVHHMGIDCTRFQFRPRRLQPGQAARLVSIARLVDKKGIEFAIRGASRIRGLDFQYDIVGDGPLRSHLQQVVNELGVADRVRLLGWKQQNEVVALLEQAHVLLSPSVTGADGDQEGIPVAMMEAMAMGLPVLSTWHSGIPELVEDGHSGILVPERDAAALGERLQGLLSSPERWADMGAAGRRRVEAEFNINRLNDSLVRLFGELRGRDACPPTKGGSVIR